MATSRFPLALLSNNTSNNAADHIIGFPPHVLKRYYSSLEQDENSDHDEEEEDDNRPITDNCDAVRREITAFLNSGEMKVTEFQRTIGVNSNSYGRFMKLRGPHSGNGNQVYPAAFRFFDDRKKAGVKMPARKKVKKDNEAKKFGRLGCDVAW